MDVIDWNAAAALHRRDDSGSELQYNFAELRKGTLGDLVRAVAQMDGDERARLVIDVAGGQSLGVPEILALAARADLP